MLSKKLVFDLILNISLLSVVASLLSKIQTVQDMILQEYRGWRSQAFLSLVFGGIIILSTYTGIRIGDYNMNTKVIGAMAAGLLGGPLVGIYASLIGAVYVYVFSPLPAFAMASAFSTVLFGLLGGGFYPYFQRGKWKYQDLFVLTCFAEICEMVALLRMTVPMQMALDTVLRISIPMILLNSVGMLIFISSFSTVFVRQDLESSRQLQTASELTKECLPLLQDGLYQSEHIHRMAEVIMEKTDWIGVMITDRTAVLEYQKKEGRFQTEEGNGIPPIGIEAMESGQLTSRNHVLKGTDGEAEERGRECSMIAAPFVIKDKTVGCMIVWMKKQWVIRESGMRLLQHLVMLASFQLTMSELEHQEMMRQKAEFKALQFQVNPHFLFNALNTISCVCREDPDRARELLLILANYFRYNLDYEAYLVPMREELDHVRDYLEIEKARFEDKLQVTYDLTEEMEIRIPTLILQPIVENAVRHGMDGRGRRIVHIQTAEEEDAYVVRIQDRGKGFAPEVIEKLELGETIGKSIGLSNVHKRMKNIYGEKHGLKITSSEEGSTVELRFLKETAEGGAYENRNC